MRERRGAGSGAFGRAGSGDGLAWAVLTPCLVVLGAFLTSGGTVIGTDAAVPLYPMYGLVGDRLADGQWPWWNPHILSGMPLAADPQSGWMYLPVMALFAVVPYATAANVLLGFHLTLAVTGMYLLARAVRITPAGAAAAAYVYCANTWYTQRLPCCPVDIAIASWLPWPLLAAEAAIRAVGWPRRVVWWCLAGVSLSQILSVWLGQGSYYALLAVGLFIGYRTLIDTPLSGIDWTRRWRTTVTHTAVMFGLGAGLAAAGLVPRLEFMARSNLADGYPDAVTGGWSWFRLGERLVGATSYDTGTGALLLALLALVVVGRRNAAPVWTLLAVVALVFSVDETTFVHRAAFALLPWFEDLQSHVPQRMLLVFYLSVALLVGCAVGTTGSWRTGWSRRTAAIGLMIGFVSYGFWLDERATRVSLRVLLPAGAVAVIVAAYAALPPYWWRRAAPAVTGLLVLTLGVDLLAASSELLDDALDAGSLNRVDLAAQSDATGAVAFLRTASDPSPVRYAGYDPSAVLADPRAEIRYRATYAAADTIALLVNDRAMRLGLFDIQGSNHPAQLARYTELVDALNGRRQDYHDANVYPAELASPLFDLLNTRYVVVPAGPAPETTVAWVTAPGFRSVYRDDRVEILENTEALPRAWIVHQARRVQPGEGLSLIASGAVDPADVALLESDPPPLGPPEAGVADLATVTTYAPERMVIETSTTAPGVLVVSEIAYPAWRAYLDGERVDLLLVDHALRGVAIPAGAHVVELRYESTALRSGLVVTGVTGAAIIAALGWAGTTIYRSPPGASMADGRGRLGGSGRVVAPRARRRQRSRHVVQKRTRRIAVVDAIPRPRRSDAGS